MFTDHDAIFDREVVLDGSAISPQVTGGTNPGPGDSVSGSIPDPQDYTDPAEREAAERALDYMGLQAGSEMRSISVDTVFIGSCTNSRIEDLRSAAAVAEGRTVASGVRTLVVPGSRAVKEQAEAEGLDKIFIESGFDWREPGCFNVSCNESR